MKFSHVIATSMVLCGNALHDDLAQRRRAGFYPSEVPTALESSGIDASWRPAWCWTDTKTCPDGSILTRRGFFCNFPECPQGETCFEDALICPDGSTVTRDPFNNCEYRPCPEIPCTTDVHQCWDGSYVGRDPKNGCAFHPCPEINCVPDMHLCPDGSYVGRDPKNGCAFDPCPPPALWRCANGQQILASGVCDGFRQCRDGSDEWHSTCPVSVGPGPMNPSPPPIGRRLESDETQNDELRRIPDGRMARVDPQISDREPVDCVMSDWFPWSRCFAECGPGTRFTTRYIAINPRHGGAACPLDVEKTEPCWAGPCWRSAFENNDVSPKREVTPRSQKVYIVKEAVDCEAECSQYAGNEMHMAWCMTWCKNNNGRRLESDETQNDELRRIPDGRMQRVNPQSWYIVKEADCEAECSQYAGNEMHMAWCMTWCKNNIGRRLESDETQNDELRRLPDGRTQRVNPQISDGRIYDTQISGEDSEEEIPVFMSRKNGVSGVDPVDCVMSDWSPWTRCLPTCGPGYRHSQRYIAINPRHGGAACPLDVAKSEPCWAGPCWRSAFEISGEDSGEDSEEEIPVFMSRKNGVSGVDTANDRFKNHPYCSNSAQCYAGEICKWYFSGPGQIGYCTERRS